VIENTNSGFEKPKGYCGEMDKLPEKRALNPNTKMMIGAYRRYVKTGYLEAISGFAHSEKKPRVARIPSSSKNGG
jgi:hypothetical protein